MVGEGPRPPGHTSRRVGGGRAGGASLPATLARRGCARGLEYNEVKVVELTVVAVVPRGGPATYADDQASSIAGGGALRRFRWLVTAGDRCAGCGAARRRW
jgi:hypothetical protein